MDFDTAKKLMDQINSASAMLAALSQDIDQLSEPERGRLMLGLGKTMGEMYLELIYPIGLQYPVLNPAHSQISVDRHESARKV
jgi:hypothetical protein